MHKKGTEERSDENKRYPCPHDRQTGSLRRWDRDKEKAKCSLPAIQSGDIAALEE